MLTQQTLEKMNVMKLSAMAEAFEQQLGSGEHATLSFEERIGLLVDCEWTARDHSGPRICPGRCSGHAGRPPGQECKKS